MRRRLYGPYDSSKCVPRISKCLYAILSGADLTHRRMRVGEVYPPLPV